MEIELKSLMNDIRLQENLKECYLVKLYYLNSKSVGLEENEINELKLQKLLIIKEVETITYSLAYLYIEYDKLYNSLIDYKTKLSMNNDNTNGAGN
jgi:hypothetical protein